MDIKRIAFLIGVLLSFELNNSIVSSQEATTTPTTTTSTTTTTTTPTTTTTTTTKTTTTTTSTTTTTTINQSVPSLTSVTIKSENQVVIVWDPKRETTINTRYKIEVKNTNTQEIFEWPGKFFKLKL
jgi:hypothetical protein